MKRYSRLASVEEKRNIKKAYYYVFLSILALIFLIFLGIPTLVRFAGFIGNVAKSNKPVEINDITPPAPPQFEQIQEYTKDTSVNIEGVSESGAIITIRYNNKTSEIVANNEGRFSFVFNLNNGENSIDAIAKDLSNNESMRTKTFKIIHDAIKPEITIMSPANKANYFGSGQRQLAIKGNISEKSDLSINGRTISLDEDSSFSFATILNEGENKFEVIAKDPAGNENSTSLTVNFTP